jgi:2-oxoglutarate dehydrogenase complex dehydrogenase (E1) component-like enzyme
MGNTKWISNASCLMVMKVWVPNIHLQELNVFYSLCAEENFQVANCTNPANYFHLLKKTNETTF